MSNLIDFQTCKYKKTFEGKLHLKKNNEYVCINSGLLKVISWGFYL